MHSGGSYEAWRRLAWAIWPSPSHGIPNYINCRALPADAVVFKVMCLPWTSLVICYHGIIYYILHITYYIYRMQGCSADGIATMHASVAQA